MARLSQSRVFSSKFLPITFIEWINCQAAVGQAGTNPKNTVSNLHLLLGASSVSFEALPIAPHLAFRREEVLTMRLLLELQH